MTEQTPAVVEPKPFWQSKTFWIQILAIVAIVWPASSQFLKDNFTEAGIAWAFVNMVLRLISKGKVEIL